MSSPQSHSVDTTEKNIDDANALPPGAIDHDPLSVLNQQTPGRKLLAFGILCLAFFLDTFNNSSLFAAIPPIALQLDIPDSESVWLLGAYQLTFAALLLISGRVSDLYNPKWVFVLGSSAMAIFALICGFLRHKILLILFRAFMGAGGALTIPSAMHIIVHMYPDPATQAKAVAAFGGMGGIGIVMGLVIGALFVTFQTWPWIFYFSTIVSCLITLSIILVVPPVQRSPKGESRAAKILRFRRLDILGVALLTIALILFIFAVTSGSIEGWKSARVLVPLILSLALIVIFLAWEARLPESYAALPPKMWRYENFKVLIIISFVPFMWWGSIFPIFSWLWETVYDWKPINVAVHFLPIALGIFPILPLSAVLQSKMRLKWVITLGFMLLLAGTILLPFANSAENYWKFAFPGFLLGTAGAALIYTTSNIALLASTPSEVSGIVTALFTSVLQTGAAMGLAIITSIQTSVQTSPNSFNGRAAGLWFLVAWIGLMLIVLLLFMRDSVGPVNPATSAKLDEESK